MTHAFARTLRQADGLRLMAVPADGGGERYVLLAHGDRIVDRFDALEDGVARFEAVRRAGAAGPVPPPAAGLPDNVIDLAAERRRRRRR